MTINFFVRSAKSNQPATIRVRVRSKLSNAYAKTPFSICPQDWDAKKGEPKTGTKISADKREGASDLKKRLQSLMDALTKYAETCEKGGEVVTSEGIEDFISPATEDAGEKIPAAIGKYWEWLIGQMRSGKFLKPSSDRYDADTIKVWTVTRNVFLAFAKSYKKPIVWDTLNKSVMDAFVKYMEDYGYMKKSINKYIITFKALIKYAAVYHGLHDNLGCLNFLKKRSEVEGCTTTKTYLNDAEIQSLYDMPLEPGSLKDKVRDLFLVGCYTCQRVSDYAHLERSAFTTTRTGTKIVRLTQEKTGTTVVVPYLNENLPSILEKYDYNLPDLGKNADVLINRYLKNILKDLSETVPSLAEPVKTTLTLRERKGEDAGKMDFDRDDDGNVIKPKYETICTHSARRSGITNLYKSRLFTTLQLMSISGHKTESNFFLYISQSSEELADEIAGIMERAKERESAASNESLF